MSEAKRQAGMHITWIIGYMGSGKSIIGHLLAGRLGAAFTDSDEWIETHAGKSIPEMFEQESEAAFRAWEKRFAETIATTKGKHVIACGGGLPCYNELIGLLLASGTVIYLEASVETLAGRLAAVPADRPLLKGLDRTELEKDIRQRLETRRSVYEQADTIIRVDGKIPETIVEEILQTLNQ